MVPAGSSGKKARFCLRSLRRPTVERSSRWRCARRGLRHTFAIVPDVSRGVCACTYAVTGGDKPLRINGSIDARAYPKDGSITADESPDYPAARARELFEQYTPLLLDAVQEMLEGCGAAAAVRDLFPGFIRKNAIRI